MEKDPVVRRLVPKEGGGGLRRPPVITTVPHGVDFKKKEMLVCGALGNRLARLTVDTMRG